MSNIYLCMYLFVCFLFVCLKGHIFLIVFKKKIKICKQGYNNYQLDLFNFYSFNILFFYCN